MRRRSFMKLCSADTLLRFVRDEYFVERSSQLVRLYRVDGK